METDQKVQPAPYHTICHNSLLQTAAFKIQNRDVGWPYQDPEQDLILEANKGAVAKPSK